MEDDEKGGKLNRRVPTISLSLLFMKKNLECFMKSMTIFKVVSTNSALPGDGKKVSILSRFGSKS